MFDTIAFISLIKQLKEENIPFELTTKSSTVIGISKAFITFPFMEGDIALLCYNDGEEVDIRIESYNTPWDPENDVTSWLPERENMDTLFQNIKMFWKGYSSH